MALTDKLTAIGNAIRAQSGKTDKIPLSQMPTEIINLQSLNFEVVGNPKPENPKQNTIWMNTNSIHNWECGATEPSGADTWVKTGKASPYAFNALNRNSLMVYPLCGLQIASSEWKYVETEIYQGGWIKLLPEVDFFANGILNTDTFGSLTVGNHNVTITNSLLYFDPYVNVTTSELFDVTSFNTIECDVAIYSHVSIKMALIDEKGNSYALAESGAWESGGKKNFDISERTGKFYLKITSSGKNGDYTTMSSIKFKA